MATEDRTPMNLLDLDRSGLEAYFENLGEKPFRGTQVFKWLHQHRIDDFQAMTNLSKPLRDSLGQGATVREPHIVNEQRSGDGTRKWLLAVDSGNCIETVFIPDGGRGTLCLSSQVGCPLDCSFCSTGKQGFNRNLSVSEIIGQIRIAARALGQRHGEPRIITNVVFMGMGEPLLNFDNVVASINVMMDDNAYGIARRRVTLSTAGLVPKIDALCEVSPCALAVSLHAPVDALRDELVPLNRKYPLRELMDACRRFGDREPGTPITFEYVLLEGVNDSREMSRALAALLSGVPAKVNLIPFNPFPGSAYRRPSQATTDQFRDILLQSGLMTITRKTRGDDIDAACGQLVGRVKPRAARYVHANIPTAEVLS